MASKKTEDLCKILDAHHEEIRKKDTVDPNEEAQGTVEVEITLPPETILALAMAAHEIDITLNEYCNNVLSEYINKEGIKQ